MLKKFLSSIALAAMLALALPATVSAATIDWLVDDDSLTFSVNGNVTDTFYPTIQNGVATGEELEVNFTMLNTGPWTVEAYCVAIDMNEFLSDGSANPNFNKLASIIAPWQQVESLKPYTFTWDGTDNDPVNPQFLADGEYDIRLFTRRGVDYDTATPGGVFPQVNIATAPTMDVVLDVSPVPPTTFNPSNSETVDVSFTLSNEAYITVEVWNIDYSAKETLIDNVIHGVGLHPSAATWDGKFGGVTAANGNHHIEISATDTSYSNNIDEESKTVVVDVPAASLDLAFTQGLVIVASGGNGDVYFDPSDGGDNENLDVTYTLNQMADSLVIEIRDSNDKLIKSHTATTDAAKTSGTYTWGGVQSNGNLVDPGTYTVEIKATKSGDPDVTSTKSITVSYNHADKPGITDFTVSPASFDPDFEDTEIKFQNTKDSDLIVEIQKSNGDEVRDFDNYEDKNYSANIEHTIAWNGDNNSNNEVAVGTYVVYVRAENNYGVAVSTQNVSVDNDLGNISTSNVHIGDISFSPSSTYEPAEDDELEIEFDIEQDIDELRIVAIKGSQEYEIFSDTDLDEENDFETTWDGTDDDDDYVDAGTWKIMFISEKDGTELKAAKSITVAYDEPKIDNFYFSKDKFDPELDEFTYILFRIDSDAEVDIFVLEDGDKDDEIEEDMNVEADKWYAVKWDGGSYDYDDDIDIKIIAKNEVNENVYDSETKGLDLAEDNVSSSKSNVTQDYLEAVITDGNDDISLYYNLEDEADVTISIHKGTSTSGSLVIELIDINDQEDGDHTILWNGRDDDGDKLSKGIYTYKIVSKKSSTDTEKGHFIIGVVGDIEGDGGTSSSGDDGKISPNVIILDGNIVSGSSDSCAGYSDVDVDDPYCDAIAWTKAESIFIGYTDGTFKPDQSINRVELLKVILEAFNANILFDDGTNQGFSDVIIGEWYMPYVRTGKSLGVFHGDAGKTTARPGDYVNRVEALKMIFETLDVQENYQISSCVWCYPDAEKYSWYWNYACESYDYDLFDGNSLYPAYFATRGEIAEALYKLHMAGVM
jgi:flagellar hook assembly protein FlgD